MSPSCTVLMARLADARADGWVVTDDAEALVLRLYQQEGRNLVRLARLFVDDVDAAEDLVQEAFIRLARHAHRVEVARAPAYLRSIVLNLARDHNRRGLVSLRHQLAAGREVDVPEVGPERLVADERQARCSRPSGACPSASATAWCCATSRSWASTTSPPPSG
jgi:DNA-directed RNA polymerase specialized sigma24 family protein